MFPAHFEASKCRLSLIGTVYFKTVHHQPYCCILEHIVILCKHPQNPSCERSLRVHSQTPAKDLEINDNEFHICVCVRAYGYMRMHICMCIYGLCVSDVDILIYEITWNYVRNR